MVVKPAYTITEDTCLSSHHIYSPVPGMAEQHDAGTHLNPTASQRTWCTQFQGHSACLTGWNRFLCNYVRSLTFGATPWPAPDVSDPSAAMSMDVPAEDLARHWLHRLDWGPGARRNTTKPVDQDLETWERNGVQHDQYDWCSNKPTQHRMDDAHQHILWGMTSENILQCVGRQGEVPAAGDSFTQTQERDDQA